jgi:hypothetical protein
VPLASERALPGKRMKLGQASDAPSFRQDAGIQRHGR